MPSLFEGFGLSAVEAQSCGACMLATDTEGLRDVIVDGETGLPTPLDAAAMAEEINRLLDDPARRRKLVTSRQNVCGACTPGGRSSSDGS